MKAQLAQIADIQLGMYGQPSADGDAVYLLVKHFDDMAKLRSQPDTLVQTEVVPTAHDLRVGDVLLTAKGTRQFAWAYDEEIGPAVASPAFFVIRPDEKLMLAPYLAIVLNTPEMRTALQMRAKGSNIPSIRKSEVESVEVTIPSLQRQRDIVELMRLHELDITISKQLIEEKEKRIRGVLKKLITA